LKNLIIITILKNNNIAIYHAAPRIGDKLIHLDFYYSIFKKYKKKIILICHNKDQIISKCDFFSEIIDLEIKKGLPQILSFIKFNKIIKTRKINKIFIFEKNSKPALFSFFSGIDSIYSYGIKNIQKLFIHNNSIDKEYYPLIEYDQAENFLKKISIKKHNFFFKNNKLPKNHIFICNKASDNLRKWPNQNLKEIIIKILNSNSHSKIYLNIDHKDYLELSKQIESNLYYTSNLSLIDLFDIISQCSFSLSVDTGPSHISLRLGIKTYVLFTRTLPNKYSDNLIPIIDKNIKDVDKSIITNRKSDNINVDYVWDYIKHEFKK
tara:strand:+ start:1085 stop:2050 length:966 start_codon:yes stop_codon:yes gene_type:complete